MKKKQLLLIYTISYCILKSFEPYFTAIRVVSEYIQCSVAYDIKSNDLKSRFEIKLFNCDYNLNHFQTSDFNFDFKSIFASF